MFRGGGWLLGAWGNEGVREKEEIALKTGSIAAKSHLLGL